MRGLVPRLGRVPGWGTGGKLFGKGDVTRLTGCEGMYTACVEYTFLNYFGCGLSLFWLVFRG